MVEGQGIAIEAVRAFVGDLFRRHAPIGIIADVSIDSPASARLLEHIGLLRTGDGMGESAQRVEPAPIWLYRLTKADFGANR